MGTALLIGFFIFVGLGVPIGFTLGILSLSTVWGWWDHAYLLTLARKMVSGCDSFTILAMPLFMLSGELMNKSGITDSLIKLSNALVGHLRGGLAQVSIVTSILFAGLTGVAMADLAAIGSIMIPAMEKEGYTKPYAAAVVASAAVIGPIIPPSLVMLIYSHIMGVSVAALFLGGVIPGLIMGLMLMGTTHWVAVKRNYVRHSERASLREVFKCTWSSIPALTAPLIILVGILTGLATATEAAVLVVAYALVLGFFVKRTLSVRDLPRMLLSSMVISSVIFFIMGPAYQLGYIITSLRLPQGLASFFTAIAVNKYLMLFLINCFLLLMGMILEIIPNVVLLSPILAPLAVQLGVDPIHFALIMLVNLNIGMNTPPMGGLLFIAASMTGQKFDAVLNETWRYLGTQIGTLFIITMWPDTVLWLPRMFGFA